MKNHCLENNKIPLSHVPVVTLFMKPAMNIKPFCIAVLLATSLPAFSQPEEPSTLDYAIDAMVYRPAGFLLTALGGVAFVATSPTSILATAFPPHNAVYSAAYNMVAEPVRLTFIRPFGTSLYWNNKTSTVEKDERPYTIPQ